VEGKGEEEERGCVIFMFLSCFFHIYASSPRSLLREVLLPSLCLAPSFPSLPPYFRFLPGLSASHAPPAGTSPASAPAPWF